MRKIYLHELFDSIFIFRKRKTYNSTYTVHYYEEKNMDGEATIMYCSF